MPRYCHLELLYRGSVPVVRIVNYKPFHREELEEMTNEWNSVVDGLDCRTLFMDCSNLRVLNSEMLSKLVVLQRRLKEKDAKLVLSGVHPEVREILGWTKLDRFFEIQEDEQQETDAVA